MKLTDKQVEKIKNIAQSYSLKLVLLFGSQVSQSFLNQESDFDVAYLPEKKIDFQGEYHLNYEFTEVFKSDRVDTVNLEKSSPLLMQQIFQNHQILFCADRKVYNIYKIYAFKRFVEAAPLFKLRDELIKNYFAAN